MSISVQKQAQTMFSNLNEDDAVLVLELMKRILSSEKKSEKKGVKIGLGKGKISYPENFEKWNQEVSSLFEDSL